MRILLTLVAILLVIVAVPAMIVMSSYNGLVAAREAVEGKAADINAQLQRRADLIPNLINSVKGYMQHEEGMIETVVKSREKLLAANSVAEKAEASEALTSAVGALIVVAENYPDLKANTNFIQLQDELAGSENRIATARRDYNEVTRAYNTRIKEIPGRFIAAFFGFKEVDYFEASEKASEVPNVQF